MVYFLYLSGFLSSHFLALTGNQLFKDFKLFTKTDNPKSKIITPVVLEEDLPVQQFAAPSPPIQWP
jgi:hypothetical protein